MLKFAFALMATVVTAGWSTTSNAATTVIGFSGTFSNGQTLSGQLTQTLPGFANFTNAALLVGGQTFSGPNSGEQDFVNGFLSLNFINYFGELLTLETNNSVRDFSFLPSGGTLLTTSNYVSAGQQIFLTSGSFAEISTAVPEPETWAMMLVGFGMVAGAARYRRRSMAATYA